MATAQTRYTRTKPVLDQTTVLLLSFAKMTAKRISEYQANHKALHLELSTCTCAITKPFILKRIAMNESYFEHAVMCLKKQFIIVRQIDQKLEWIIQKYKIPTLEGR